MNQYTVWVDGLEVNDYLLTESQAQHIADLWRSRGYCNVVIECLVNNPN
jgi:hypothetical protein